jgi:hypothetical protein
MDVDFTLFEEHDLQGALFSNPIVGHEKAFSSRLLEISELLGKCKSDGIVSFVVQKGEGVCVLKWSKMLISNAVEFRDRVLAMVTADAKGNWNPRVLALRNPTWGIYEVFRKIGLRPRFRGPPESDPGKHDMLYYKEWHFKKEFVYSRMPAKANRAAGGAALSHA